MQRVVSGSGFVTYRLGDATVTALYDGYVDMPPGRLRQADGRPFGADLPWQVALVERKLRLSVNAFLVESQGSRTLIDTGASDAWEPTMGRLLRSMAAAGIDPASIDAVALTHTHVDHVSGLVAAGGSEAFPNLRRVLLPKEEVRRFERNPRVARFRARCVAFSDGHDVAPGLVAVSAAGHEAGHTAFQMKSGGETLTIWGDIVHVPSIQFARPDLTWEFDANQPQAHASRLRMLGLVSRAGSFVAGAHLDFPGVGRVTRVGDAYAFAPI